MENEVLLVDGLRRLMALEAEYKKKLKQHEIVLKRINNRYFSRTTQRTLKSGEVRKYDYYYTYEYRDSGGRRVNIPVECSRRQVAEIVKRKKLRRHQRFVSIKQPEIKLPREPKNPLEGLNYRSKGSHLILTERTYRNYRKLFKNEEAFPIR